MRRVASSRNQHTLVESLSQSRFGLPICYFCQVRLLGGSEGLLGGKQTIGHTAAQTLVQTQRPTTCSLCFSFHFLRPEWTIHFVLSATGTQMYHNIWARLPPRRVRAGRNMNKGVTGYVTTRDTGTDGRTGRSYVFPRGQRRIHNFRKESEAVSNIGRRLGPPVHPPTGVRGVFCRVVSHKVKVNSLVFCRVKSQCVFVSLGRQLSHMSFQNAPRLRPDGSQSHPSEELLPVSWTEVILRRFSGHSSHFNVPGRGRALVYSSGFKVLAIESLRHSRSKGPGPLGSELRKDIG